jgi:hypothetical protein
MAEVVLLVEGGTQCNQMPLARNRQYYLTGHDSKHHGADPSQMCSIPNFTMRLTFFTLNNEEQ